MVLVCVVVLRVFGGCWVFFGAFFGVWAFCDFGWLGLSVLRFGLGFCLAVCLAFGVMFCIWLVMSFVLLVSWVGVLWVVYALLFWVEVGGLNYACLVVCSVPTCAFVGY